MSEHSLVGLMLDGGWVMWALLVLSLASLAVTVERSWVLRRARVPVPHLADALSRTLGSASFPAAALEAVQRHPQPALEPAQLGVALSLHRRFDLSGGAVEAVEAGRQHTPAVTGMIASFGALADFSTTNPALVAEGIEEALITTAAGLAVAVPVHLIHGVLSSRVSRIVNDIEDLAHLLLDLRERRDGKAVSWVLAPVVR